MSVSGKLKLDYGIPYKINVNKVSWWPTVGSIDAREVKYENMLLTPQLFDGGN